MGFSDLFCSDLSLEDVKVFRHELGRRVNGKLRTSLIPIAITISSVQPLTGRDLEKIDSGRRQKRLLKFYTECELLIDDDQAPDQKADIVEVDGERFEIFQSMKFRGLGLDHYVSFGARLNA